MAVPTATYRIDLAYDGTGFRGYARNRRVRTVQGELESALATVLGVSVDTIAAGRTDAGVHARHQVVSFGHDRAFDVERAERSLQTMLRPEIEIRALREVPEGFHARFDASGRRYRYFIDEATAGDPLRRHWVWHYGTTLDVTSMNRAADDFVGEHDFASFCRAKPSGSTVRTVRTARWSRSDQLLVYEVGGKAFCHQLVRSMVALCVEVGRGRLAPDAVPAILDARDRNAARGAAPPHGLVLWEVSY